MPDPNLPPPPNPPVPPIEEWTLADPPPRPPAPLAPEIELLVSDDVDPPVVPVVRPRARPAVEELPEARPLDPLPPVADRVPTVLSATTFPRPVNPTFEPPEPERPQARVILALGVLLLIALAMVAAVTVLGYTIWAGFKKMRPATPATATQQQEQPVKQGRKNR